MRYRLAMAAVWIVDDSSDAEREHESKNGNEDASGPSAVANGAEQEEKAGQGVDASAIMEVPCLPTEILEGERVRIIETMPIDGQPNTEFLAEKINAHEKASNQEAHGDLLLGADPTHAPREEETECEPSKIIETLSRTESPADRVLNECKMMSTQAEDGDVLSANVGTILSADEDAKCQSAKIMDVGLPDNVQLRTESAIISLSDDHERMSKQTDMVNASVDVGMTHNSRFITPSSEPANTVDTGLPNNELSKIMSPVDSSSCDRNWIKGEEPELQDMLVDDNDKSFSNEVQPKAESATSETLLQDDEHRDSIEQADEGDNIKKWIGNAKAEIGPMHQTLAMVEQGNEDKRDVEMQEASHVYMIRNDARHVSTQDQQPVASLAMKDVEETKLCHQQQNQEIPSLPSPNALDVGASNVMTDHDIVIEPQLRDSARNFNDDAQVTGSSVAVAAELQEDNIKLGKTAPRVAEEELKALTTSLPQALIPPCEIKDRLRVQLDKVGKKMNVACVQKAKKAPNPGLFITDFGHVSFPLDVESIERIILASSQATDDGIDRARVQSQWEVSSTLWQTRNSEWGIFLLAVCSQIEEKLKIKQFGKGISAKPSCMILYGVGAHVSHTSNSS